MKNPFKLLFDYCVLAFGLLLLALMLIFGSIGLITLCLLSARCKRKHLGRVAIMRVFRSYLGILHHLNIVRSDVSALDTLQGAPGMILAPNHPSLLDALLVTSRFPNVVCIMKAQVLKSLLFGQGAKIAGYIPNGSVRDMVTQATEDLHGGAHLLLFPEGTRTTVDSPRGLTGSLGVIAKRAQVEVQTLRIETDSQFLGKNWRIYRLPQFPVHFRVTLGRRFAPPQDVKQFMTELEDYFQHELKKAPPCYTERPHAVTAMKPQN